MAAQLPDFALLYARLGLPPDCTLEQFKHACRQRIAELHPDRASPGAATPDLGISELLSLYAGAVRFHRRHGRLPGGQPVVVTRATAAQMPAEDPEAAPDTNEPATPSSPSRMWLLAALPAALLLLWASLGREAGEVDPPLAPTAPSTATGIDRDVADTPIAPTQPRLALGMDPATVRAIQGEPMQSDDRDWIYGPSWIRFEKGRVVDWYSSPLHRLRTAKQAPTQDEIDAAQR